jgi:AcrR family transcriptional regulator
VTSVKVLEPNNSTAVGAPAGTLSEASDLTVRICQAFITCVAGKGLRATSIDDVAREACCGRATIYRVIPGGREGLLIAAVDHSLSVVVDACAAAVHGSTTIQEAVARSVREAASTLADSVALQRLLAEEPGAILPFLSFDGLTPVLHRVAQWSPMLFGRFVTDAQAGDAGEWVARVVLGHLRTPGGPIDLTDLDHCRRLVDTFFIITPESPHTNL